MVQFAGKYTRTEEEKYEDFLAKLGLNYLMRKAATVSTPTMEITDLSGGKWKMVTSTKLKSVDLTFEFGKEFEEKTADGRTCKTTVTKDGENVWITNQIAQGKGEKNVKVIREFTDKGIAVQMICEDVTSKQFYTRD